MTDIAGVPLIVSEVVGRVEVIAFEGKLIVHPLMRIELEHSRDLDAWSAAVLAWIGSRADRMAAAAFTRIDSMYADGPAHGAVDRGEQEVVLGWSSDRHGLRWPTIDTFATAAVWS